MEVIPPLLLRFHPFKRGLPTSPFDGFQADDVVLNKIPLSSLPSSSLLPANTLFFSYLRFFAKQIDY